MEKMDNEEYQWNKKELLKHRNLPYHFANDELAAVFFDRLREEYSAASIHYWKIHQWICLNDRARAKLREDMIAWSSKLAVDLSELCANIETLKKGGSHGGSKDDDAGLGGIQGDLEMEI